MLNGKRFEVLDSNIKLIERLCAWADDDMHFFREVRDYLHGLGRDNLPFEKQIEFDDHLYAMCGLLNDYLKKTKEPENAK